MAEHPTIFSTEMVRAVLDGRKTQTRRIIKPQPEYEDGYRYWWKGDWDTRGGPRAGVCTHGNPGNGEATWSLDEIVEHCPYGKVGDTLWVREAWSFIGTGWSSDAPNQETIYVGYKADNSRRDIILPYDTEKCELCNGLKIPGKINPYGETTDREAYLEWQQKWWEKQKNKSARFMFRWAARIFLEITNIRVERVQNITLADIKAEGLSIDRKFQETKDAWIELWDSLNSKRGYCWDKNPFVWIIEFKRVT